MALKTDRYHVQSDISYFMNEVAERGGVVCYSTIGSGAAMDDSVALVTYAADPSGLLPVGVLMNDMVNLDLTRQHINWHKDEVQIGSKVTLWTKGDVVTDMRHEDVPAVGMPAYLASSGLLTIDTGVLYDDGTVQFPIVGVFKSSPDEDGFVKVSINLPMATPRQTI